MRSSVPMTRETVMQRVERHLGYLYEDAVFVGLPVLEFESLLRRFVLIATLESCGWNAAEVGRKLGIHRNIVNARMRKLGIKRPHGAVHGVKVACRCGLRLLPCQYGRHMAAHIRRGEAKPFLPRDSDHFEYRWLKEAA